MDDTLDFILDRVNRHDMERSGYKERAYRSIKMWKNDPEFKLPLKESILKGMEQVVLPTPYNTVNLGQRLLSSTPRVQIIPSDITDAESEGNAEKCEKWVNAMWPVINQQQRRNVISDNIWNVLTLGRYVFDVRWIKDQLPELQKKKAFPFSIRALNPLEVGIKMGPYMPEFAYHMYESTVMEVIRRWKDLKDTSSDSVFGKKYEYYKLNNQTTEDTTVTVIDYWATDPDDGSIYNAVLIDDEYGKPYNVTSYPAIPLIGGRGDFGFGLGDEFDGLGILHSIDGLWQYQCRLASQMATGILWYFWPEWLVTNELGHNIDDVQIGPGQTETAPPGTRVEQIKMDPNVPLAQEVYQLLNNHVEQGTFSPILFGQSPAEIKSGYGVSLLSNAATGKIKNFQESLEQGLSHVIELVLCLTEKKAGKAGVDIWGIDDRGREKYRLNISKKEIEGNYANRVSLAVALPTDDLQRVVQGTQLVDRKVISMQSMRDDWIGEEAPSNETERVALEEFMQSDEMRPYRLRTVAVRYFGEEQAMKMMYGTELMPPAPDGYEYFLDEKSNVTLRKIPPQPPGPPEGEMPPEGMPPEGGMPPGGPPMGPEGMPPEGMPPGMPGGEMMPPSQPPGMPGIPPVMQGQLEGESLGLPQDVDPLLMQAAVGQPTDQELLAMSGAGQGPLPGGVPL